MSLYLEEEVIGESVRSVPAVIYAHFFIIAISQFFSFEAVMLDIVNGLEVYDRKNNHKGMDYKRLSTKEVLNSIRKNQSRNNTQHSIIHKECLSQLFLIFVHSFPRIYHASYNKGIYILSFFRSGWVQRCCNPDMMPMQMMIGEVHVEELYCVESAEEFVVLSRLMDKLMRHHELGCVIVACDKGETNDKGKGFHCDFHSRPHVEGLEEDRPRKDDCRI